MTPEDISKEELLQELRRTTENLDALIKAAPVAIMAVDTEGRVTLWNPAAERMFGFTPAEVLGKPIPIVPDDAQEEFQALMSRVLEDEGFTDELLRRVRKDGSFIDISLSAAPVHDSAGRVSGAMSASVDVSERKRAAEAIAETAKRYRMLFEFNPQPMWVCDVETLAFLAVNEAAIHRYGYSREEFLSMTLADIRPPEDVPALRVNVARVSEGVDDEGLWRHLKKDGTLMDVEVVTHALEFAGRRARLVMATDVTERRKMEQLKRDFTAMVSHEMRSPLTTILGYVTLLERIDPTVNQEMYRHTVSRLGERARMMHRLVEDLLNISRIESGQLVLALEGVDVLELVQKCVELLPASVHRRTTIDCPPGLPRLTCDPQRLSYALTNLLENAIKFSPEGGPVQVTVRENQGMMSIAVRDEGVGIPPEELPHVFERFRQADMSTTRSFGGFGLGLFIAKQVVEAHGGSLEAVSTPSAGTTFTMTVPTQGQP